MSPSPILLIILGIILIWTGINGTLGTLLSALFSPQDIKYVGEG